MTIGVGCRFFRWRLQPHLQQNGNQINKGFLEAKGGEKKKERKSKQNVRLRNNIYIKQQ